MCKVRLADLLFIQERKDYIKYFNKISGKHIDFVICDKNLKPLLLIELDDKSHLNKSRQERDKFLDNVFENLDIDFLHIKRGSNYQTSELAKQINEHIPTL